MGTSTSDTARGKAAAPRALQSLARRLEREHNDAAARRDPAFIAAQVPLVERLVGYFSPTVTGIEHLPTSGPVLVVGNHSALYYMPDIWVVGLAVVRRRGVEQDAYALAHDLVVGLPGIGPVLRRIGALPASSREAERALRAGALVLVYPGGDWEACRPWTARNRIDFHQRKGFVRLALRTGVPVVPVVAHGAHHAVVVVSRGARIARALGLHHLRIDVFPLVAGPLGVLPILAPPPLPAAVTVEFLAPLDWRHHGPQAADDDQVVDACFRQVTRTMQAALDRLRAEHPYPVMEGVSKLAGRAVAHVVHRRR